MAAGVIPLENLHVFEYAFTLVGRNLSTCELWDPANAAISGGGSEEKACVACVKLAWETEPGLVHQHQGVSIKCLLWREFLAKKWSLVWSRLWLHPQFKASIQVCEGAQPIIKIARPVAYALKEKHRAGASETGGKRDYLQSEPRKMVQWKCVETTTWQ